MLVIFNLYNLNCSSILIKPYWMLPTYPILNSFYSFLIVVYVSIFNQSVFVINAIFISVACWSDHVPSWLPSHPQSKRRDVLQLLKSCHNGTSRPYYHCQHIHQHFWTKRNCHSVLFRSFFVSQYGWTHLEFLSQFHHD